MLYFYTFVLMFNQSKIIFNENIQLSFFEKIEFIEFIDISRNINNEYIISVLLIFLT